MREDWHGKNASDLTPEELRDYARDALYYEARMFRWASERLHSSARRPRHLNNAVVEAVYIHGRCLFDFLRAPKRDECCPEKPANPNSVHASHYTKDWRLRPEVNRSGSEAWKFVIRGNTWVAHLTTQRLVDDPDKALDWEGPKQVWAEFQRFVAETDPSRLHTKVRALARRPLVKAAALRIPRGGGRATTNQYGRAIVVERADVPRRPRIT